MTDSMQQVVPTAVDDHAIFPESMDGVPLAPDGMTVLFDGSVNWVAGGSWWNVGLV